MDEGGAACSDAAAAVELQGETMALAFDGIRVIDFTQVLAGPFATQQLAMLGADVIKVEQPGVGDQTRQRLSADDPSSGITPTFLTCNVGKRSLTLDLKHPRAVDIVRRLVASADAVVENFRPGVMGRLGFDYEACRAIKSDIVYCSISGYGQAGPKSGVAAYDGAVQADSGMMSITGSPESGPMRTGYMPVDMASALNAAFAISAALFRRMATGEGQHLDVAMMDTAVVMQAVQFARFFDTAEQPPLFGNRSPTGQPTANVFRTSDGFLQVLALRQSQAEKLFSVLGCPQQLEQPAFATPESREENYDEVVAFIGSVLAERSTEASYRALREAGVPVSEIRSYADVHSDPQFEHRHVFVDSVSPVDGTTATVIGTGYVAATDTPRIGRPAPNLGEHTEMILSELEFTDAEISELRSSGAL